MDRPPAPKPRGTHFPHPGSSHHLWTVFVLLAVALCRISSLLRSLRGHVQGHAFGSVAGKDHAGAGTACRSSKSIALSPKSIFTAKAASAKFGKEKPRGNTTARRSRCKGKDRGKGSGAKLDEHRAMTRHHGQAEGDGAVRHNSRSTERSSQGEIYAAHEKLARRTSAKEQSEDRAAPRAPLTPSRLA